MKTISGKKGQVLSDAALLGWRAFLIALILLFVVITIVPAFTAKQDIRQQESSLLADSVIKCISSDGVIKNNFSLDCVSIDVTEYYVNVSLFSSESNFNKSATLGNSLEVECRLAEKFANPPFCMNQKYYTLIDNNGKIEKGALYLLVGIKKIAENVQ